jgi:beta-galactosidase/beta-glucuronidase
MNIPRPEHPRPDFYRPTWLNLNGPWEFEFFGLYPIDDESRYRHYKFSKQIIVPFPYQSPLSGIGYKGIQPRVWYRRLFDIPQDWEGQHVLLHFGAVDYHAKVWVNDILVGDHRGGHVPFTFDITSYIRTKDNEIRIRVFDGLDLDQPRGKQSWMDQIACWYTQTTGIWQTVWLEAVPQNYIESVRIISDFDDQSISILVRLNAPCQGLEISPEATFDGKTMGSSIRKAAYPATQFHIALHDLFPWSPETPNLYDLKLTLRADNTVVDTVQTYFGMRKVSLSKNMLLLNNEPYYQRLVLDQGFWPDGLYTAPSDEALKADVEWGKKLGFNGCRKHMKVEDPRFLYWADKLGFLVWGEFPAPYEMSLSAQAKFLPEWQAAMERDINHPAIIAWTPFNESWGIRHVETDSETQRWVRDVVQMTKLIDPTRLVIDNDGWFHLASDIYGYHDYSATADQINTNYERARTGLKFGWGPGEPRLQMMVAGLKLPDDMPIMITEFGGIGFIAGQTQTGAWGYADLPKTVAEFQQRYEETFKAVFQLSNLCGYVYTQLTDVEQEINGLLTPDRKPKFDPTWLAKVNKGEI